MMTELLYGIIILTLIPAINTIVNLFLLKTPCLPQTTPSVAVLIPARDEEAAIGPCIDAALASTGADIEVIVLDDSSEDATFAIVATRAQKDSRLRVVSAPKPPPGWSGKSHACHVLSELTDRPFLLFVDADVRLMPEAAARLVPPEGVDLISGVPRQIVHGLIETAAIPMINSLIFGYLPVWFMRHMPLNISLTAACGQMLMVRASSYRSCGGHREIAQKLHDGLQLARLFRRKGYRTDLVDGTKLATCRMYNSPRAVWHGFSKNATEGMARPLALPIWTVLLFGGQLLPAILAVAILMRAIISHALPTDAAALLLAALALLILARTLQALRCEEPIRAVFIHPLGVLLTLCIQWNALFAHVRGREVSWRGRAYAPSAFSTKADRDS
jgi:hypothetical protein